MRRPRCDGVDTWHHVVNRGVSKRTLFEGQKDMRMFLACVAREVRRGTIEVHAFCLMTNHFHLLVRSVTGNLSAAMRNIQNRYSRWFNRMRGRRGPLYESRFRSSVVESLADRRDVVSYIHDNPIDAGMVAVPHAYAWSSAACFVAAKRPKWLATTWVDDEMARRGGAGVDPAERLLAAFPVRVEEEFRAHIAKRISVRLSLARANEDATLHYLESPEVVERFIAQTALGDGTRPFKPPCRADVTEQLIAETKPRLRKRWRRKRKKRARSTWYLMRIALLRLSGLTLRAIGYIVGRTESAVSRDMQHHRRKTKRSKKHRATLASLVAAALTRSRTA